MRLILAWDYHAFPLWRVDDDGVMVDRGELPISAELSDALQQWSDDQTRVALSSTGPSTRSEFEAWRRPLDDRARELVQRLRDELPGIEVSYSSPLEGSGPES